MSRKRKRGILTDHKRTGKRFVPPLMDLGIKELSWVDQILPQLLWCGLLVNQYGMAMAMRGFESVILAGKAVLREDQKLWMALTSSFGELDDQQRRQFIAELEAGGWATEVRHAIEPLVACYPRCPMSFLLPHTPECNDNSLEYIREVLKATMNRWDDTGTYLQIMWVYSAFIQGRLFVQPDSVLARLPEVESYPHTEISRHIASGCRATVNSFFNAELQERTQTWCKYFWQRGLELEPCGPIDQDDV